VKRYIPAFLVIAAVSSAAVATALISACATTAVVDTPDALVDLDATPPCVAPLSVCNNSCIDPQRDNGNCGACNQACKPGEICAGGKCSLSCGGGSIMCGATCTTIQTDPSNCGKCGNKCSGG